MSEARDTEHASDKLAAASTSATELLVIGAGPYGLSTAALARDRGLSTVVVAPTPRAARASFVVPFGINSVTAAADGTIWSAEPRWHRCAGHRHRPGQHEQPGFMAVSPPARGSTPSFAPARPSSGRSRPASAPRRRAH